MTQRIVALLGCDMESGKESDDVRTVTYKLDGIEYEIELCGLHARRLEEMNEHARVVGGKRAAATGDYAAKMQNRKVRAEIREWANRNGWAVSKTGRIPAKTMNAYTKLHGPVGLDG